MPNQHKNRKYKPLTKSQDNPGERIGPQFEGKDPLTVLINQAPKPRLGKGVDATVELQRHFTVFQIFYELGPSRTYKMLELELRRAIDAGELPETLRATEAILRRWGENFDWDRQVKQWDDQAYALLAKTETQRTAYIHSMAITIVQLEMNQALSQAQARANDPDAVPFIRTPADLAVLVKLHETLRALGRENRNGESDNKGKDVLAEIIKLSDPATGRKILKRGAEDIQREIDRRRMETKQKIADKSSGLED